MLNLEQMSFLDELFQENGEREKKLREFCLGGSHTEDSLLRIWALYETRQFPQYRDRWLRNEFGTGGHSLGDHWFADYNAAGVKLHSWITRADYVYTWKEVARAYGEIIEAGDLPAKPDEAKIEAIANTYGQIPYPRARMKYPECAWGVNDEPIWRCEES